MTADALAADNVLCHFRWVDGDADTWNMLRDADSLSSIVAELARLRVADVPDLIVGIEARGFVFAPMVPLTVRLGLSPIGRRDAMCPGQPAALDTAPDHP